MESAGVLQPPQGTARIRGRCVQLRDHPVKDLPTPLPYTRHPTGQLGTGDPRQDFLPLALPVLCPSPKLAVMLGR